jgi:hypothetical protein
MPIHNKFRLVTKEKFLKSSTTNLHKMNKAMDEVLPQTQQRRDFKPDTHSLYAGKFRNRTEQKIVEPDPHRAEILDPTLH